MLGYNSLGYQIRRYPNGSIYSKSLLVDNIIVLYMAFTCAKFILDNGESDKYV